MKKISLFLSILITAHLLIGCSFISGSPASHGKDIANKIQKLYEEKSQYLSDNSDKLFLWKQQVDINTKSALCTIVKDEKGNWQYYKDDYERILFKAKDEAILKIISMLYNDYEVLKIEIADNSIQYFISEDSIIYSKKDISDEAYTEYIKDNWYHFKFPYGI